MREAPFLSYLAISLKKQRKYEKAESVFRESILLLETTVGGEHYHLVGNLIPLGQFMFEQRRYDEAEPLYRKALAICRKVCNIHIVTSFYNHSYKVLGEEHPDVADSIHELAGFFYTQGEYDKAEPLYRQSLAIRCKVCVIYIIIIPARYLTRIIQL
jgi:tetratricopeptide (TPR) repeat protein